METGLGQQAGRLRARLCERQDKHRNALAARIARLGTARGCQPIVKSLSYSTNLDLAILV